MAISKETISALQKIVKEEYGRKVSFIEAFEITGALVNYFDLLAKLYHQDKEYIDNQSNNKI